MRTAFARARTASRINPDTAPGRARRIVFLPPRRPFNLKL
jgi:hypothetical protein